MAKLVRAVIEGGEMRFVYDDALAGLAAQGEVRRASHVEPASSYGFTAPGWVADMRPSGGGLLLAPTGEGAYDEVTPWDEAAARRIGVALVGFGLRAEPFGTREAALAAEREWLHQRMGL